MNTLQSELYVMQHLLAEGFRIARCDDRDGPYDLISDWQSHLYRLQVKTTERRDGQGYHLAVHHTGKGIPFTKQDTDFIIGVIISQHAIYIIPIEVLRGRKSIMLYPHWEHHRYSGDKRGRRTSFELEPYRDAFHLLKS